MAEDAAALIGLHGLRLPAPGLEVLLAAFAIGLFLAALVALAARMIAAQGPERRRERALRRLAATRSLPPEERMVALATLLREETPAGTEGATWRERARAAFDLKPGLLDGFGPALYRPGAAPDPAPTEAALARAFRRLKG